MMLAPSFERSLNMLILSRELDDQVLIGDNVTVTVVEIRGDKVRLGFDAPLSVPIVRTDAIDKTPKSRAEGTYMSGMMERFLGAQGDCRA